MPDAAPMRITWSVTNAAGDVVACGGINVDEGAARADPYEPALSVAKAIETALQSHPVPAGLALEGHALRGSPMTGSTAVTARRHRGKSPDDLRRALAGGGADMTQRPSGHTAVMSGRQATAPDALDYFPTPPWAARAGAELIKSIDPGATSCWEPACGEGHMAWGLRDYFAHVGSSDIHPYGGGAVFDFLSADLPLDAVGMRRWDWIVTNPPFKDGEAFVRAALPRAGRGVAMLLRSVFLEGAGRRPLFTDPDLGFAVAAQFAERVPMVKGRWDPQASSATAYSWFVWLKHPRQAGGIRYAIQEANAAGGFLGLIIPPCRTRLHRREDLARFCGGGDGGELFGGA